MQIARLREDSQSGRLNSRKFQKVHREILSKYFGASNESNEVAGVEAMVKKDESDTETVFRDKFMEDSMKISHNSHNTTSGGDLRNEGTTTIEFSIYQFLLITE